MVKNSNIEIERRIMQTIFADAKTKGVTMLALLRKMSKGEQAKNPQAAMTKRRRFAATGNKPARGGTFNLSLILCILAAMSELTGDKYELKILKNGADII